MINKTAIEASYFAPSVKELQHADNNSKNVANILLAALGISAAGYGTKYLVEGLNSSRMSDEIKPSVSIQRKIRNAISPVKNKYIYSDDDDIVVDEDKLDAAVEALEENKEASFTIKSAGPIEVNLSLFGKTPKRVGLEQNFFDKYLVNRQNAQFSNDPEKLDVGAILSNKDKSLATDIHYDPSSLETNSAWTKYISAPLAKLGPQSILPLAAILGSGLVAAPMISKSLVKRVSKALPEPKRHSDFLDTAKDIYDEDAEELKEVGYKQEKDKAKRKKEASKKENKDIIKTTRAGGNPAFSAANIPTIAAATLLAYAAYKGMHGFDKGMDRAKNDLAHNTQFLRGWRATNKLRDYNYNPFGLELEEEPGLKEKLKDKDEKVKALLSDLKDSDEIEFNPAEVRRLTGDYLELT